MREIVLVELTGSARMPVSFRGADCGNGGGGAVVEETISLLYSNFTKNET